MRVKISRGNGDLRMTHLVIRGDVVLDDCMVMNIIEDSTFSRAYNKVPQLSTRNSVSVNAISTHIIRSEGTKRQEAE